MNQAGLINSTSRHKLAFYLVMGLFGALFCTISVANHYYFRSTAFDYGPYNYALKDYAHFRITTCYMYKVFIGYDITFLQDHFSLFLMYLVPFYWLLNWLTGTYTLLLIQTAFILWGAQATYKLVSLKTGDGWLGVGAVVYYFLLQGRNSSFDEDCNIIIMCACFVPVFLWYFESKKYVAAFIIFILSMFSREDMPLWFAFIFLLLLWWHRKEKKLVYVCLGYLAASVVCFILTFKVFIPLTQDPKNPYSLFNYGALGDDPSQALMHVIKHPIDTFELLFRNHSGDPVNDGVKMEFYWVYLISGAFVLFYRPQYLIWFVPLIAQKMFNDEPVRWSIESYYTVQVATILPLAVFLILGEPKSKPLRYSIAALLCILALGVTIYEANPAHRKFGYGNAVKRNIFASSFFNPPYNSEAIHRDLELIPPDAHISASASILPHLSQRKYIYEFPYIDDAQYLAIFAFHDFFKVPPDQYNEAVYNQFVFDPHWQIIANDFPFLLLKKVNGEGKTIQYDSIICNAETLAPDHKHLLTNDNEMPEIDSATWNNARSHSGKYSLKLTKDKPFGMTFQPANLQTGDILCVTVWRHSDSSNIGALVLSNGKDFYLPSSSGINKDSAGWDKLVLYCGVPIDHTGFKIYVWNNGNIPVWFDDLEIKKYKTPATPAISH